MLGSRSHLLLVEAKTPGLEPLCQPVLDLLRLLAGATQGEEIVRVADKDWGVRYHLDAAGGGIKVVAGAPRRVPCREERR